MKRFIWLASLVSLLFGGFLAPKNSTSTAVPPLPTAPSYANSASTIIAPQDSATALVDGDYYMIGFPYDTNIVDGSADRYVNVMFSSSTIASSPNFVLIPESPDHDGFYSYYLPSLTSSIFRASTADSGATFTFYSLTSFLALNYDSTSTDVGKPLKYDSTGTAFPITLGSGGDTRYSYFGNATTAFTLSAKDTDMGNPTILYGADKTTYGVTQSLFNIYHLDASYIADNTAYGLASKLKAGTIATKAAALAAYQALPPLQRYVLSHTITSEGSALNATMQNAVVSGISLYTDLCTDAAATTQTYFQAATPAISVNYALDRFAGFMPGETYQLTVNGTAYSSLTPTVYYDGSYGMRLIGSGADSYNAYGQSVQWKITSTYGTDYDSGTQTLSVLSQNPADLSAYAAQVTIGKTFTDEGTTIDTLFNDEIILAGNSELEYMLVDVGTAATPSFLTDVDTIQSWDQDGDLTALTVYEESTNANIILGGEKYAVYFRLKATSAYAASAYYATPFLVTTLTYNDGMVAHGGVKNYQLYRDYLGLATTKELTTTKHILAVKNYLTAHMSVSLTNNSYAAMIKYYDAACQLDTSLSEMTKARLSSDSAETDAAYASAYQTLDDTDIINFIDYSGDPASFESTVSIFQAQLDFNRYKENKERTLVTFFNENIITKATSLSDSEQKPLWDVLTTQLSNIKAYFGVSLTPDSQGEVDTLYTNAVTALAAELTKLVPSAGGGVSN